MKNRKQYDDRDTESNRYPDHIDGWVNTDGVKLKKNLSIFRVENYRPNSDLDAINSAIRRANAASPHYSHNIVLDAKSYYVTGPLETIRGNAWLRSVGKGRRSSFLTFEPTGDDQSLVKFSGGFGGGISDIRIDLYDRPGTGTGQCRNIVGLHLRNCSSFTAEDFEVSLEPNYCGDNSTGIYLERYNSPSGGNDSITLQKFNCKAAVPMFFENGDNITVRDFDIHVNGNVSGNLIASSGGKTTVAKSAAFKFGDRFVPANHVFGPGTTQKGHHVIHCDSAISYTGNTLYLYGIRSEQMTVNETNDNAAYHFRVTNIPAPDLHGYDSIEFRACRSSGEVTPYSFNIHGSARPPIVSTSCINQPSVSYLHPDSQIVREQ